MESATFRKWLTERGSRFDRQRHEKRGQYEKFDFVFPFHCACPRSGLPSIQHGLVMLLDVER